MSDVLLAMLALLSPFHIILIIFITIIVLFVIPNIVHIRNWLKKKKEGINHHLGCPYFGDPDYIKLLKPQITEAIEKAFKIWELREKNLVDEQMSAVEKTLIKIKAALLSDFRKVNNNNRDIRAYSKILDFTLSKGKDKLREFIISNHFLEKTESEYSLYVRNTAEILQEYHVALLDEEYYSEDFDINRDDLLKYNRENNMNTSRDMIEILLFEIRDISIKYSKKIKEVEDTLYD